MANPIERVLYILGFDLDPLRSQISTADGLVKGLMSSIRGTLGRVSGVIGLGLGLKELIDGFYKLGRATVDMNAQMEIYEGRLYTIFQNQEAVRESLQEIIEFAATTPFEISELVEATVHLEAYGQNASKWLPLVGEFAAAMAVDLGHAVRAVSRALTGSAEGFEVLRNNGISSARLLAAGWSGSVQDIESSTIALEKVLGEFGGGMQRLSQMFRGIMSNISDAFTQFLLAVGEDFFEGFKDVFERIRDRMFEMLDTGEAERWANRIAGLFNGVMRIFGGFITVVDSAMRVADKFFSVFERRVEFADLTDLTSSYEDFRDQIDRNISTVDELFNKYQELEDELASQGKTVAEAVDENEELRKVIDALAKIVPDAVTGFDQYNRVVGFSTEKVMEFITAQREMESIRLSTLAAQYKNQMNEIQSVIDETIAKQSEFAEIVNRLGGSMDSDQMIQFRSELEKLVGSIGAMAPFEIRQMVQMGRLPESLKGFEKEVEDILTAVYNHMRSYGQITSDDITNIISAYLDNSKKSAVGFTDEIINLQGELNNVQRLMKGFVTLTGLQPTLDLIEKITQTPVPRENTEELQQLANAYARIAKVFELDFRDSREEVVKLTNDLITVSKMGFDPLADADRTAQRQEGALPKRIGEQIKEVKDLYQSMVHEARQSSLAIGQTFDEQANATEQRLQMLRAAIDQYISEKVPIPTAQTAIRENIDLIEMQIDLQEKLVQEAAEAADERFRNDYDKLTESVEYEAATYEQRIQLLDELVDKHVLSADSLSMIDRDQRREALTNYRNQIQEMEKLDRKRLESDKKVAAEILDSSFDTSNAIRRINRINRLGDLDNFIETEKAKMEQRIANFSGTEDLEKLLQNNLTRLQEAGAARRIQIIEDTRQRYKDEITGMIEDNMRALTKQPSAPFQLEIEEAFDLAKMRVMLGYLESGTDEALEKLAGFRFDDLKDLSEYIDLSIEQYKALLQARLESEATSVDEVIKIRKELADLDKSAENEQRKQDRIDKQRKREQLQRWKQVANAIKDVISALEDLGIMSGTVADSMNTAIDAATSFASGDLLGGTLKLVSGGLSILSDHLKRDKENREEMIESTKEYSEAVEEIKKWNDAIGDEWIEIIQKNNAAIKKLGDDSKDQAQEIRERWKEEVKQLAEEIVPILESMNSSIVSTIGGVISDALLGELDEDFGVAMRKAIYNNVISQIAEAFAAGLALEPMITSLVSQVYNAMEAAGTGDQIELNKAIRSIESTTESIIGTAEQGVGILEQSLSGLTNALKVDVIEDFGRNLDDFSEITQSLARGITEPQGNEFISLMTASTGLLRSMDNNIALILESINTYMERASDFQLIQPLDTDQVNSQLGYSTEQSKRSAGIG